MVDAMTSKSMSLELLEVALVASHCGSLRRTIQVHLRQGRRHRLRQSRFGTRRSRNVGAS